MVADTEALIASERRGGVMKKLCVFVAMAFGWTWVFGWPVVAYQHSSAVKDNVIIFLAVGAFGPTISAFATQYIFERKEGVLNLVRRCHPKLIPRAWVLGCLFLVPTALCVLSALFVWFGGAPPKTKVPGEFFVTAAISIPVGALGEEFGWRGVMLPDAQTLVDEWRRPRRPGSAQHPAPKWRWSPVVASIVIGAIWATWHLPSFFVSSLTQSHCNFGQFFLGSIFYSVLYTWQSNSTNGSILAALVMHASINTFGGLNPWGDVEYPDFLAMPNSLFTLELLLICLALVWVVGPELGREDGTAQKSAA